MNQQAKDMKRIFENLRADLDRKKRVAEDRVSDSKGKSDKKQKRKNKAEGEVTAYKESVLMLDNSLGKAADITGDSSSSKDKEGMPRTVVFLLGFGAGLLVTLLGAMFFIPG